MKSLPEILKEIRPEFDFTSSRDFIADGMLEPAAAHHIDGLVELARQAQILAVAFARPCRAGVGDRGR